MNNISLHRYAKKNVKKSKIVTKNLFRFTNRQIQGNSQYVFNLLLVAFHKIANSWSKFHFSHLTYIFRIIFQHCTIQLHIIRVFWDSTWSIQFARGKNSCIYRAFEETLSLMLPFMQRGGSFHGATKPKWAMRVSSIARQEYINRKCD